jgi:NTP pyrophosphatase (non-canonical NTP hydrolase)
VKSTQELKEEIQLLSAQLAICTRAMRKACEDLNEVASAVELGGREVLAAGLRAVASQLSETRAAKVPQPYCPFERYRQQANRTRPMSEGSLLNAALGLGGEAGEVQELVKKQVFHKRDFLKVEMTKEIGDVLFYLDWVAALCGISLQDAADQNIAKLKERYPDGFVEGGGKR